MSGRARPKEPLADWCEVRLSCCDGRANQRHHKQRRSQGGGDDKSNTLDVCTACHDHIHHNPTWAYENDLLRHAWANETRTA